MVFILGNLSVKIWMKNLDCTNDEVLLDNNQICQLNKRILMMKERI